MHHPSGHRPPHLVSRRELLRIGGAGVVAVFAGACGGNRGLVAEPEPGKARLAARPGPPPLTAPPAGPSPIGLGSRRDGVLYVPGGYSPATPAPLVLMLHGSGGSGRNALRFLQSLADRTGFLVLSPDSRDSTWDAITDEFGPNVTFIDRALAGVFAQCAVDPSRVAVAGFSDGATYALALGRVNGDLFSRAIAFSPGFLLPVTPRKFPRLFVSHGTGDRVLPIGAAGRRIVAELREAGYSVRYREFEGGHEVPPRIAQEAVRWFLGTS